MKKGIYGTVLVIGVLFSSNLVLAQKCPEPKGLGVDAITETSATLHWEKSSEHRDFEVTIMHGQSTPAYRKVLSTKNNQETISDLISGGNYRFRVKASCEKGKGNSKWFEFSTLESAGDTSSGPDSMDISGGQKGPCPKVVNMAVRDVTDTTAVITWHTDDQHVSFRVDAKSKNHTTSYNQTHTTSDSFFLLKGLEAGGNYHFRVKASCSSKSAGSSKWIDFSTTGGDDTTQTKQACVKPKNLSVLEVTSSSALLNWYHPDSSAQFDLDIKNGSMTPQYSMSTTLTQDSFLVDSLYPGGQYSFRLKATCGDGSVSGSSDWAVFKTLPVNNRDTTMTDSMLVEEVLENREIVQNVKQLSESSSTHHSATELTVYPNPATSFLVVEIPEKQIKPMTQVQLLDLAGRVVFEEKVKNTSTARIVLEISSLNPGYYKLIVRSGHYFSEKLIYFSG